MMDLEARSLENFVFTFGLLALSDVAEDTFSISIPFVFRSTMKHFQVEARICYPCLLRLESGFLQAMINHHIASIRLSHIKALPIMTSLHNQIHH